MDKQHAHQLLDRLDPGQLEAVVRLLEVMIDPQAVSIRNAPIDDEPVTEAEERAVAASKEWFKDKQGIPFEEVVAELGSSWNRSAAIRDPREADRLLRTSQSRHSRHPATDRDANSHRHSPAGRDRLWPGQNG